MEKVVPKLRFPEFNGEWDSTELGKVFSIFNGYAFSSNDSVENGTLWVKIADVGILEMKYDNLSFLPENFKNKHEKFLLKKGDFVIALTRPILNGKLKIAQINDYFNDSLLNQRVGKIVTDNCNSFVYCLLQKEDLVNEIENSIAGTDPPNLSPSQVNSISVFIPSLNEQTKIASFLSNVDSNINLQKKKKSLLEQYKIGIMQRLLSQEFRFKDEDGNDFPIWTNKKLCDIAKVIMGQSPDSKSYNSEEMGLPLIQGNADIKNRLSNPRNWTTQPTKICEIGDLIMTVRAPVGTISKSLHHACIGRGVCAIKSTSKSDVEFLYQLLIDFESKWTRLEQGSTFTAVSGADINSIILPIPTLPEQTKIAKFLTALDDKIAQTALQIEKMQLWKKGLLQQMFV